MLNETLRSLSREDLLTLLEMDAKNWLAIDGVWFQSVERTCGMDDAMYHDGEAWKRFTVIEARRIKTFLGLEEHPGLEGLAKALPLRLDDRCNPTELIWKDGKLIYRNRTCRVQTARSRKDMPYHPCKPVGLVEYSGFARTIDDRITCRCLSCYPEITDESCACAWEFSLETE